MSEQTRIDVHCHLFNLTYALREILDIKLRHAISLQSINLPEKGECTGDKELRISLSEEKVRQIIRWFLELMPAVFGSCEKHYKHLDAAFKASSLKPQRKLTVSPLMMDIYYFLEEYLREDLDLIAADKEQVDLKTLAGNLGEIAIDEIRRHSSKREITALVSDLEAITVEITSMVDQFAEELKKKRPEGMSLGYAKHFNDLIKLQSKYPASVFPFLAVDPNRKGIEGLVKTNVSKKGPFYGVKLYTRLGYLPDDPKLDPIYAYCEENDLPIIVHCSDGGFPPGDDWKYKDYANPQHWAEVLEKHKKLKVDFAHFGKQEKSGTATHQWRDTIIGFMKREDLNVYADLAYYPDPATLETMQDILSKEVAVRKKLMFGTDYVMVALTPTTDLQGYFDNFKNKLPGYLDALMTENPKAFLNI